MKEYTTKNHRWIIGTLLAMIVPLLVYSLQKYDSIQPETKTFYYTNFEGKTKSNGLKDADCWVTSLSSNRSDTFRCSVDNGIYDPCFENPSSDSVISCPGNPNEVNPETFKMISRPKFDEKTKESNSVPWYIILNNNQNCRFITGATDVIANRRLDYGCDEGTYGSLFLPLKENGKELMIGCSNKDRIEFCSIKEAWY